MHDISRHGGCPRTLRAPRWLPTHWFEDIAEPQGLVRWPGVTLGRIPGQPTRVRTIDTTFRARQG
jgi:hypothetical protein